ncbi:hypothetical protein E2C01_098306 [Portunus trituberculatus]|uniref:Uncharacterized protein n=1 Tax=Portunus trituberculatus TaxID=210409 RepID=A0A5B7KBS8_PORTR|nr:hypothetical protein [Portunus trituberculatus]
MPSCFHFHPQHIPLQSHETQRGPLGDGVSVPNEG